MKYLKTFENMREFDDLNEDVLLRGPKWFSGVIRSIIIDGIYENINEYVIDGMRVRFNDERIVIYYDGLYNDDEYECGGRKLVVNSRFEYVINLEERTLVLKVYFYLDDYNNDGNCYDLVGEVNRLSHEAVYPTDEVETFNNIGEILSILNYYLGFSYRKDFDYAYYRAKRLINI